MDTVVYLYIPLILGIYIFTKHFLHKIKNLPPSPFPTLPILGHLHLLKKPLHRTLSDLSARYGPIFLLRFGSRPVLIVSSPSAAEECLAKNDIVFANRPRLLFGKIIGYNYSNLVWAPYGDHWRNLRRISSIEILSSHRLQMLAGVRADEVRLMTRKLFRAYADQTVDMKKVFFELLLNVMMRMIAGKRYYGETVEDVEEATRFREIVAETFHLGGATNMGDYLPVLSWLGVNGLEKKLMVLHKKRDGLIQELIEQHRRGMKSDCSESKERKKTMIEVLLSLQQTEPEYYTDEIIRGMMLVLLSAGTDTSAGTLEWGLSLLLNNPEALKKAQIEIDNQVGQNRLIDESDLSKLPYLHCIINETLRMYPAGPMLVPHESSEECTIGGFRIPHGTMLMVNLWAIQNDPKIWVDPRKFKPERFQDLEGSKDGFKLFPFGTGRRGCPGEGLAIRMVGLALGSLVQCFEWERVSQEMIDMTEGTGLTLPKAQPLLAKCRPRPIMLNLLSQI
ncbi:cytochrome P450 81Q32-like [Cornus florida]|uniref:cytochrome P450 81Q32-like n=1 Tax=Cornus florida TaxID=4283 RepID=UPI00289A42C1|nr:cytochrome P450 81Q32-like [Cornus florida]